MDPKTGMYKRGVHIASALCKCARCGCQFYMLSGQAHRFLAGAPEVRPEANGSTHTHANGTASRLDVIELAKILERQRGAQLDGLAADPEDV